MKECKIVDSSGNLIKWVGYINGKEVNGSIWTNHSESHEADISVIKGIVCYLLDNIPLDSIKIMAVNEK